MKKLLLLTTFLLLFVLACGKTEEASKSSNTTSAEAGNESSKNIKEFDLKTLDGKVEKSSKIFKNGKPTLFLIVAEWCPHCRDESPDIKKFYNEYKDKVNVVVVYTNNKSSLDKVKDYVNLNEYTFPAYYDENGVALELFEIVAFPSNFKIVNGKIEKEFEGKVDYETLVSEFIK